MPRNAAPLPWTPYKPVTDFLLSHVFGFHAFTASVILMLHHHRRIKVGPEQMMSQSTASDAITIEKFRAKMRNAFKELTGGVSRQMLSALEQLQQALVTDNASSEDLHLQIPLPRYNVGAACQRT